MCVCVICLNIECKVTMNFAQEMVYIKQLSLRSPSSTDMFKLNDRGEFYHGFCWNSVCYAGKHTLSRSSVEEGLYFRLFQHFCKDLPPENTVIGDSRFCSPKILAWAKSEYNLRIVFMYSSNSQQQNNH